MQYDRSERKRLSIFHLACFLCIYVSMICGLDKAVSGPFLWMHFLGIYARQPDFDISLQDSTYVDITISTFHQTANIKILIIYNIQSFTGSRQAIKYNLFQYCTSAIYNTQNQHQILAIDRSKDNHLYHLLHP